MSGVRSLSVGRGPQLPGQAGRANNLFAGKKMPERKVVGIVDASAASNTSATVIARIINPSRRLSCSFSVAFEPTIPQAINSYNSAVWTPRAMRPGQKEAELHTLESGIALPRMYELDSAFRLVQVSCTLKVPLTAAAAAISGQWILQVDWEPNLPLCEEEVDALYSECSAQVVGTPPTLNL